MLAVSVSEGGSHSETVPFSHGGSGGVSPASFGTPLTRFVTVASA